MTDTIHVTWVGHSTFLVQAGGLTRSSSGGYPGGVSGRWLDERSGTAESSRLRGRRCAWRPGGQARLGAGDVAEGSTSPGGVLTMQVDNATATAVGDGLDPERPRLQGVTSTGARPPETTASAPTLNDGLRAARSTVPSGVCGRATDSFTCRRVGAPFQVAVVVSGMRSSPLSKFIGMVGG